MLCIMVPLPQIQRLYHHPLASASKTFSPNNIVPVAATMASTSTVSTSALPGVGHAMSCASSNAPCTMLLLGCGAASARCRRNSASFCSCSLLSISCTVTYSTNFMAQDSWQA
eukprot:GHRR01014748.1.p1 GENE.GHRR01014748.1~~GHRR01014748.1.p1  ORF type:complete len:113 (-),score=22.09 GHRR01014748.1:552-890(-)